MSPATPPATPPVSPPIFDGHNDLFQRMLRHGVTAEDVVRGLDGGHIDLPRARAGGFGGGFFAIFVPSPADTMSWDEMAKPAYRLPLPDPLPQDAALEVTRQGFAALEALEAAGALAICRTAAEIAAVLDEGTRMAAVLHIEGAEAIDPDFARLEEMHARGLRSLGPVWSRPTAWGEGVPFAYPVDPDTGGGLTAAGKTLIRECNRLRILVDLSHLNARGVADVAAISDAPLVATHSNAWAVCPHARNLTDRQLAMIGESGGMVGINFAAGFLRPDGRMDDDVGLDVVMRHLDHLIGFLGEDGVGFGSDFDGALIPRPIGDCAGLPALRAALADHGVDAALMAKLAHGNWLRVLRRTWGG
ncbi:membrane dipeptidase [Psychromarinibacter sp. C21-152]|uniref:Membrane dipeptidase n=1 Tax=Psychromarinibacter sediminicola TaxID=3033385 RepID=A0AAE3NR42_9RHOB|nr:membrane dipeptidase [Psychromarinibacter sediminicola]MDF0602733.1 membrane dipeptidase [Psychromarinibacter sediminicola]